MESKELKYQARLEKLENHYQTLKTSTQNIEEGVKKITNALLGTEYGDIGLVERFKDSELKLREIEKEQERLKIYFKQALWVLGTVGGAVIVILVKYIFKGL